jgi:hypothetical protein
MVRGMTSRHSPLLAEIEAFMSEADMSASYFGKRSAGNSELVARLRSGGRVWPETEAKVRSFILMRRELSRQKKRGREKTSVQASPIQNGERLRTKEATQ